MKVWHNKNNAPVNAFNEPETNKIIKTKMFAMLTQEVKGADTPQPSFYQSHHQKMQPNRCKPTDEYVLSSEFVTVRIARRKEPQIMIQDYHTPGLNKRTNQVRDTHMVF